MRIGKQCIAMICMILMLGMVENHHLDAQEYCTDGGGYGYVDAHRACCVTPAVAFALVALAGIVAVAFHNSKDGGNGQEHVHCD